MTSPVGMRTQPTEFVAVIKLVNCYIATHTKGNKKVFIPQHLETDIKIAQAAAESFAKTKNIPYEDTLLEANQPIITVLKHGQDWFPAELHADKITLLTNLGSLNLGGSQQGATNLADAIALSRGADCIPSIDLFRQSSRQVKEQLIDKA